MTTVHIAPDGKKPLLARKCGLGGYGGLHLVLGLKASGAGRQ